MLFVGCKSEQENVSFWRTPALVFYLFILTWAEVVLSYGGKGEETRGTGQKEPLILDIVFIAVFIHTHTTLLFFQCCELCFLSA